MNESDKKKVKWLKTSEIKQTLLRNECAKLGINIKIKIYFFLFSRGAFCSTTFLYK